jgi:site-specific recombinase XerD
MQSSHPASHPEKSKGAPQKRKGKRPTKEERFEKPIEVFEKRYFGFLEGIGKSLNTIKNYRSDLNSFKAFLEERGHDFRTLKSRDFEDYALYLQKRYKPQNTSRRKLLTAKSFYEFLARRGPLDESPASFQGTPEKEEGMPWVPTSEQLTHILQTLKKDFSKQNQDWGHPWDISLRDLVLLRLLSETGILVSQCASLSWKDLESDHWKNDKDIPLYFSKELQEDLVSWRKRCQSFSHATTDRLPLFIGANRYGMVTERLSVRGIEVIFERLAKRFDLPKLKARSLRHYAALFWLRSGVSEKVVLNRLALKSDSALINYRKILKKEELEKEGNEDES